VLYLIDPMDTSSKLQELLQQKKNAQMEAGKQFLAENAKRAEVHQTPTGLQYEILQAGTGNKPGPTTMVTVHYEGKLIGVPQKNCFKILPKNKNLNQLVPEVCGNFLFASYKKGNLKKSLGRLFEVIEKISNNINKLEFSDSIEYNANWKLCVENSLDEYHIVKVHPTNAGYYGFMKNFKYFEEGKNLILFSSENSKDNLSYKEFCKNTLDNKIDYSGYKIFNLFPSTSLVIYFGFLYFTNFQIVSNKKTINNIEVFSNKSNKVSDLYVRKFVDNFLKKSVDEDKVIIERYQEVLNKDAPHNLQEYFSVYEERIKKFRQSLI
jgi:phenylpropionate dioxygenase-like ring-hydroxylating dioxygenase large terminal subunit